MAGKNKPCAFILPKILCEKTKGEDWCQFLPVFLSSPNQSQNYYDKSVLIFYFKLLT